MKLDRSTLLRTIAALSVLGTVSSAQVPTAIAAQGQHLPGTPADHLVTGVGTIVTNASNHYALVAWTVNEFQKDPRSWIWGSLDGSPGHVLRSAQALAGYQQDQFDGRIELNDADQIVYRAGAFSLAVPGPAVDTLWIDDALVFVGGDPIPSQPGETWNLMLQPELANDGTPWFIGSQSNLFNLHRTLYSGLGASVHVEGGLVLPPFSEPLDADALEWGLAVSRNGAHWMTVVNLDAPIDTDKAIVMDGQVLHIAGRPIREKVLLDPVFAGMAGERWEKVSSSSEGGESLDTEDTFDVNSAGDYAFAASTTGDTATDALIVKNGEILFREGDMTASGVISPHSARLFLTESGDLLHTSRLGTGVAGLDALWWNEHVLLRAGESIDIDGDGALDPETEIIWINADDGALAIDGNCTVYVECMVDVAGTPSLILDDLHCIVRIELPELIALPTELSLSAGGTIDFALCGSDAEANNPYFLLGTTTGNTPGVPLGVDVLPLNPSAYFNLTLQSPNQPPLSNSLASFNAAGHASAQLTMPAGSDPSLAGLTLHHAYLRLNAFLAITGASNAVATSVLP